MIEIKIKKLNENATIPSYKHDGDAGMDISSSEYTRIPSHSYKMVKSGIAIEIPEGFEVQVRPRSGLAAKSGIVCVLGTIDNGYRGEVGIIIYNHSEEDFYVRAGDRLAQLVVAPIYRANLIVVDEISDSDRGVNGFGSTGI